MFILNPERERKGERGREKNIIGVQNLSMCPDLESGNQAGDPSVHRMMLKQPSLTSQGEKGDF